jgi:hypothetical protein
MLKKHGEMGRDMHYTSFVMATMLLLCLEIYERGLLYSGRVLLSKHVIRYDPWSWLPNYNLTSLSSFIEMVFLIPQMDTRCAAL